MNQTWWVKPEDLDEDQADVLQALPEEDLLIIGPPGSGKTNILLLRANYVRSVAPRILFLTFTRTLTEFLRSGPNVGRADQIQQSEISTFMAWARQFLRSNGRPAPEGKDFSETRMLIMEAVRSVIDDDRTGKLYDVIFIDEVQDFLESELRILRAVSERLNAAGDSRQAIWEHKEGLPAIATMTGRTIELTKHYRIGRKICAFADRILPPKAGDAPMIKGCNYDEAARESSVRDISCGTLSDQCDACIEELRKQIRYIADEPILVLARTRDARNAFWDAISDDDELADRAMVQQADEYQPFGDDSLIRVMTVASAKGSEARAVHVLCADEYGPDRRELAFTAVTRAKTEVILYHSGPLPGHMQAIKDALPSIDKLF